MSFQDVADAIDGNWGLITQDLRDLGIDVWDKPLMRARPWMWLRTHIEGLVTKPIPVDAHGNPQWPNRLLRALDPPGAYPPRAVNE